MEGERSVRLSEAFTFDPKLTLDGIMTLAAGVIAFVAVVLQIRSRPFGGRFRRITRP
jgi:hypothetical protein